MEQTQALICSGKIRFTSPEQAQEIQQTLLNEGFKFFSGAQQPRQCFGAMWRAGEIRTAANQYAFKAYGVPEVAQIVEIKRSTTPPKPKCSLEQRAANARKAGQVHRDVVEDRIIKLMHVVTTALKNIKGYEPNLYGTNSRSQARGVAWEKLYQECVRLNGSIPQEGTLRTAIRRVLIEKGKPFMIPDSRRTTKAMRSVTKDVSGFDIALSIFNEMAR